MEGVEGEPGIAAGTAGMADSGLRLATGFSDHGADWIGELEPSQATIPSSQGPVCSLEALEALP
jgi:hypothetical protein